MIKQHTLCFPSPRLWVQKAVRTTWAAPVGLKQLAVSYLGLGPELGNTVIHNIGSGRSREKVILTLKWYNQEMLAFWKH